MFPPPWEHLAASSRSQLDALAEVWGRYPGAITEIWLDGGENNQPLNELIVRLQPQAVLADGKSKDLLPFTHPRRRGHRHWPQAHPLLPERAH